MAAWEYGSLEVGKRQQASGCQHLFGNENVLSQVSAQGVADRHFVDAAPAIAITFGMVDGGMVNCRLDHVTLAGVILLLQVRPHLDQGNDAFVAQDQRPTLQIPAIDQLVVPAPARPI